MSVINLGRTTKTNIAFYQSDGMGRDGYITYNNAGFWKDKHLKIKNSFPHKKFTIFHSLIHQAAPFNYYSDGSGRDTYIMENNAGLVKSFDPLAKQNLPKFLRQGDEYHLFKHKIFLTKSQRRYLNKIKKIQDSVVSRLYNDSLEKIKKNKMELRTDSINDFFNKDKIKEISGIKTPNNEYNNKSLSFNFLQNEVNTSVNNKKYTNLKKRNKKNIFDKIVKYRNLENSLSINDKKENKNEIMNKKIKVLKNLRINANGLKFNFSKDDIKNKIQYNKNKSLSPNYITNKNILFGCDNLKKLKNKQNLCFLGNNTYRSYRLKNNKNIGNIKYIYNLKKDNPNIKKEYFDSRNFVSSETNKTNNE